VAAALVALSAGSTAWAAGPRDERVDFTGHWIIPGLDSRFSSFYSTTPGTLDAANASTFSPLMRPITREGFQIAGHYEPFSWAALDLGTTTFRSRYADGALELVPGVADRSGSIAASARIPGGWMASLMLDYLGTRPAAVNEPSIKPTPFLDARLAYDLTKDTRLRLDLLNLTGRQVRDVDYLTGSTWAHSLTSNGLLGNPIEPRGARLSLRVRF
jgi:outer membrane receptor protein involved in Fe transport